MASVNRGARLSLMPKEQYRNKLRQQILSHINKNETTGCWEWSANKTKSGYGMTRMYGKVTSEHRAAYFAFIGDIDRNKDVCHK